MSTTIIPNGAGGPDGVRAAEAPRSGEATRHFGSKSRNAEVWVAHADNGYCKSLPDRPHDGVRSYR